MVVQTAMVVVGGGMTEDRTNGAEEEGGEDGEVVEQDQQTMVSRQVTKTGSTRMTTIRVAVFLDRGKIGLLEDMVTVRGLQIIKTPTNEVDDMVDMITANRSLTSVNSMIQSRLRKFLWPI